MCGIYGITSTDHEFVSQYIQKCKHRGPDGSGEWGDHTVTLGHNLLSIMADPKVSRQPWKTLKGNVLVYNGEIFNYFELINRYHKQFKPKTECDTELLAWGLDTFGLDFIDQIDSMHGFAYYDTIKKEIILSRDHAGIKPVFYAEVSQGLIFGSEIKGMLDYVPNARIVDPLGMGCYALAGINATRNTVFSGIKKLLAGETIVYDIRNQKIKQTKRIFIKPNSNSKLYPDEFKAKVRETVSMCSIGQRKIGVFLSGGLDSSIVAYELKRIIGEVNTFTNRIDPCPVPKLKKSGIFSEDYNSDANCAKVLAQQENFNHTEITITPQIILDNWDNAIYYMEQPMYNQSISMYCYTNKFLSDKGIVVTMAGDMGDELFGGYPKYQVQQLQPPTSWKGVITNWTNRLKNSLSVQGFGWQLPREDIIEELIKCYPADLWNPNDPVASYMALDCVTQVPEEFFNRNDKFGMAYGMEGRFPLATKMFMQYCLNIPSTLKVNQNIEGTKQFVKSIYSNYLPQVITTKPKTGWTVPIRDWLKLKNINEDNTASSFVNTVATKGSKARIPAWILHSWIKRYNITI